MPKALTTLVFLLFFLTAFLALLFPEVNPDLFWHLASGRKAQELGQLFLTHETFSFTKPGVYWLNYEWLFERIVWQIYQLGGFRGIVLARAFLVVLTLFVFDRYAVKFIFQGNSPSPLPSPLQGEGIKKGIRIVNLFFVFACLASRASTQPELFTFLFLVLFFILRDSFLSLRGPSGAGAISLKSSFMRLLRFARNDSDGAALLLTAYCLLFVVWANIHGGFVFALGILGLQIVSRLIQWVNKEKEISNLKLQIQDLTTLLILGFGATLINPYGIKLYQAIAAHAQDAPFISQIIQEWQETQFYHHQGWSYWFLFGFIILSILIRWRKENKLAIEDLFLVIAFGFFASQHIRNVAVFGLVCLPIFWRHIVGIWRISPSPQPSPLKGEGGRGWMGEGRVRGKPYANLTPRTVGLAMTAMFWLFILAATGKAAWGMSKQSFDVGKRIWRLRAIPREHVHTRAYPEAALQFIKNNPELLKLRSMVEWGWGGYAIWRLHDQGLRVFFDGRYIFHDLLHEASHVSEEPKEWGVYEDRYNIELYIFKYPDNFLPTRTPKARDTIMRSWHGVAISPDKWALVWWDANALVFVRRSSVDKKWLQLHEYKSRFPVDPYLVEFQAKRGKIKIKDLRLEISRNIGEVGLNERNAGLLKAIDVWQFNKL